MTMSPTTNYVAVETHQLLTTYTYAHAYLLFQIIHDIKYFKPPQPPEPPFPLGRDGSIYKISSATTLQEIHMTQQRVKFKIPLLAAGQIQLPCQMRMELKRPFQQCLQIKLHAISCVPVHDRSSDPTATCSNRLWPKVQPQASANVKNRAE